MLTHAERVEKNFNKRYGRKGGVEKLMAMVEHKDTLREMGSHFGVSETRIAEVIKSLTGRSYGEYLKEHNISRTGLKS